MSSILGLPANVVYATAGVYALLVLATLVVTLMRLRNPGERYQELSDRVDSWWWMIGAFTALVLLNRTVAIVFLAFISYLALKEYLSLIPTRRIDREVLLFAYLAIPIEYYWAAIDWWFMHGLSKALPRGSALLVPFNVTVSVGEALHGKGSYDVFVAELEAAMTALAAQEKLPVWE
jgi:predicted CDP-diglyceride synthetase/phosphatidate cytidylyltransferase